MGYLMIHQRCMTRYTKSISKGISKDIEDVLKVSYRYTKHIFKVFSCSAEWYIKGILTSILTDILKTLYIYI
jgi:hypothetical protein